jgi:hypothetical protein
MKIVITGINTTNVNHISWCLGAAGLSGMDTVVDSTKRVVETDGGATDAEEFGLMLLALHEHGFIIEIQRDENPPTVRFHPETLLVSAVPAVNYIVEIETHVNGISTGKNVFGFPTIAEAVSQVNACIDTNCGSLDAQNGLDFYGAAHYFDRHNKSHCVIAKAEK